MSLVLIQEKRRLQEEQDKVRREKEDERLRQQQLKVWHTHAHLHPAFISLSKHHLYIYSSLFVCQLSSHILSTHSHRWPVSISCHVSCFCLFPGILEAAPSFAKIIFMWLFTHTLQVTALLHCFHIISKLPFPLPTPRSFAALRHIPQIVQSLSRRRTHFLWSMKVYVWNM